MNTILCNDQAMASTQIRKTRTKKTILAPEISFKHTYAQKLKKIESSIARYNLGRSSLAEAAKYSLSAGGKRLRPVLLLAMLEQKTGRTPDGVPAALAIEMVHTFSLIHDDLPCIDNAELRRGRPCCHKAFGEATAVLAGDQLLNEAYRLITRSYSADTAGQLSKILAETVYYLIEGEHADIEAEKLPANKVDLDFIYRNKTARMIAAPIAMGLTLAGWSEKRIAPFVREAEQVGIAFQIIDDLLDETGDPAKLGKNIAQDERKKTFLKQKGRTWCEKEAARLSASAIRTFKKLPKPEFILTTIDWLLKRDV